MKIVGTDKGKGNAGEDDEESPRDEDGKKKDGAKHPVNLRNALNGQVYES
jgi:hypothetical protein